MDPDTLSAMRQSIVDGAPDRASDLARQAMLDGFDPLEVIHGGYVPGMHHVGEEYAHRRMFLPDMLASAEAMKAAMTVLDPALKRCGEARPNEGIIVLGTTKGDIHEIGKTLVGTLLTAHGFQVHDLGVDVASEQFAAQAEELAADVVGVSALLTTTMRNQKSVVEALDRAGLRPKVKIVVGGAPVTQRWAEEIGADGYGKDAISAVGLIKDLLHPAGLHAE